MVRSADTAARVVFLAPNPLVHTLQGILATDPTAVLLSRGVAESALGGKAAVPGSGGGTPRSNSTSAEDAGASRGARP